MYWTRLSDIVAAVEPRIPGDFIAGECLARVRSIADHLPANASNFFGFERYLGRDDPRVDFALGVSRQGTSWLISNRHWPQIADIFDRSVEHVADGPVRPWLEFDTSRPIDPRATPCVYIGLNPRECKTSAALAVARSLDNRSGTSSAVIERCIELCPESIELLYLGAMRSRNVDSVRLSLAGMSLPDLVAYLRGIRWPGDVLAVEEFLARFETVCKHFGPQLDVTTGVQPRLGVELKLYPPPAGENENVNASRLLQLLVRAGICSAAECAELENWPARITYAVPLIDRLIEAAHPRPDGRLFHGALVTTMHHVKFAFESDGSIRTKAYFGVVLDPR